jgi:hypothetical protein
MILYILFWCDDGFVIINLFIEVLENSLEPNAAKHCGICSGGGGGGGDDDDESIQFLSLSYLGVIVLVFNTKSSSLIIRLALVFLYIVAHYRSLTVGKCSYKLI